MSSDIYKNSDRNLSVFTSAVRRRLNPPKKVLPGKFPTSATPREAGGIDFESEKERRRKIREFNQNQKRENLKRNEQNQQNFIGHFFFQSGRDTRSSSEGVRDNLHSDNRASGAVSQRKIVQLVLNIGENCSQPPCDRSYTSSWSVWP